MDECCQWRRFLSSKLHAGHMWCLPIIIRPFKWMNKKQSRWFRYRKKITSLNFLNRLLDVYTKYKEKMLSNRLSISEITPNGLGNIDIGNRDGYTPIKPVCTTRRVFCIYFCSSVTFYQPRSGMVLSG